MKIEYTPTPFMTETDVFGKFDKAEVIAAKQVIVDVSEHTKTRLWLSLRYKTKTIGVNYVPPGSEHLKFHLEVRHNMFAGNSVRAHYFVVSKKQGLPELEEHVKNIVKNVFSLTDDSDFTIIVWTGTAVRKLQLVNV